MLEKKQESHFKYLAELSEKQQDLFLKEYYDVRKSRLKYVLFALFLGNLGAHKFYTNKLCIGILYLIFCWTFIPAFLALLDIIYVRKNIINANKIICEEIIENIKNIK